MSPWRLQLCTTMQRRSYSTSEDTAASLEDPGATASTGDQASQDLASTASTTSTADQASQDLAATASTASTGDQASQDLASTASTGDANQALILRSTPPDILHSDTRSLLQKFSAVNGNCIDEGAFHLKFDPRDYVKQYPIMEYVRVPGTTRFVYRATDDGLILLKSLMDFLSALHDSGFCICPNTPLTLDNIAISSEGKICIQIEHVKFISLMTSGTGGIMASLIKSGRGSIHADYKNAASVIKDLLRHSNGAFITRQLPEDMRWWFDAMEACTSVEHAYLVRHHTFLLSMNNRSDVYLKFHNYHMNLSSREANSVSHCVPIYNWYNIASGNVALQPWFKYNNYTDCEADFFRLLRNCFCHKEMSAVNINWLTYALFPEMLCGFQKGLWDTVPRKKLIYELKMEENFPCKKSI